MMDYETRLKELKATRDAAQAVKKEVEARWRVERDAEIAKVEKAVNAKYAEEFNAASRAHGTAAQAMRDHIDANASHPWEGKRVVRTVDTTGRWSRTKSEGKEYGYVEVRRRDTALPGNMGGYRLPDLGQPFVRLINASGKTGLKLAKFDRASWKYGEWQLAEESE